MPLKSFLTRLSNFGQNVGWGVELPKRKVKASRYYIAIAIFLLIITLALWAKSPTGSAVLLACTQFNSEVGMLQGAEDQHFNEYGNYTCDLAVLKERGFQAADENAWVCNENALPSDYFWTYSAETVQNVTKDSAFACQRAAEGADVEAIKPGPSAKLQSSNSVCNASIYADGRAITNTEGAYYGDYNEYTCNITDLQSYSLSLGNTASEDWSCNAALLPDDYFWNYTDLTGSANITSDGTVIVDAPPCPPAPNGTVACTNYASDVRSLQTAETTYYADANEYNCNATELGFSPLTSIGNWTCNGSLLPDDYQWYYSAYDGSQTVGSGTTVNCPPAPNATGFGGATNINDFINVSNAHGLILEVPGVGRIYWPGPVNASGANLNSNVFIEGGLAGLNAGALHSTFNSTANITLYNLSYATIPVIYSDGRLCSDCMFLSYSGKNLTFQVAHFTNYTAGANAQLSIWDENDPEGGSRNRTVGELVTFYANYTNMTSGAAIGTGGCNVSFNETPQGPVAMTFNATSAFWEYRRSFATTSVSWNASCNATGYEALNATDSLLLGKSIVNNCTTFNSAGAYVIGSDLTTSGHCLIINASNVEIDCQGHSITYTGTFPANNRAVTYDQSISKTKDRFTLRNCIMNNFSQAVYLYTFTNSSFINNTIYTVSASAFMDNIYGFKMFHDNGRNVFENNSVTFVSCSGYAFDTDWSNNGNHAFRNNRINLTNAGYGFSLLDGNNTVYGNDIRVYNGGWGTGISLGSGCFNSTISYNNISVFGNTNRNYSIALDASSRYNLVHHNRILSSVSYYIVNNNATNMFNTSAGGVAQGNYYADILNWQIYDTNGDGFGDTGLQYPYNGSMTRWSGSGADWGPMDAKIPVPQIDFVLPTPSNGTSTTNRSFIFNASVNGASVNGFKWNWNGSNYNFYDSNLLLMLGLNNLSVLGEGNTKAVDSSIYGNNGTVYNAVWNSSGKYGGGYTFNGDNTVINVTGLKKVEGENNEFTIEAWINPVQGGSGAIVTKSVANQDQTGDLLLYLEPADRIAFAIYYGGWNPGFIWNPSTTTYVDYNKWSHVVVTHTNQSDGLRVYLNGQLLGHSSGLTINEATSHSIMVGMQGGGGGGWLNRFNGAIDEVRIYNRSLSEAEVLEHYRSNLYKYTNDKLMFQSNCTNLATGTYNYQACARNASGENCTGTRTLEVLSTVPHIFFVPPTPQDHENTTAQVLINISVKTTSLGDFKWNWNGTNNSMYAGSVAMFNFDNDSALGENNTNVRDISRYNNNGIISDATYVTGKNGNALRFYGNSSSHVTVSGLTKAMGQNSSVTAMTWVKLSSVTIPDSYIMTKGYAYVDREGDFLFWIKPQTQVFGACVRSGGSWNCLQQNEAMDTAWHHYTFTNNASGFNIYYDGELANSAGGVSATEDTTNYLGIGAQPGSPWFMSLNGTIDEVRIYNRSLTSSEIKQYYASTLYMYGSNNTDWLFESNPNVTNGFYTYFGCVNDIFGAENCTETRTLNVDLPPVITVVAPAAYTKTKNLNVTLNEAGSWCGYMLDGGGNFTMDALNATTFGAINDSMTDGGHTVTFYCNDTNGNMSSSTVNFYLDTTAPLIYFISPTPPSGAFTQNTSFVANASVSDVLLNSFEWGWNGTNYSFYDRDLQLMLGFNDLPGIGENSTYAVDASSFGYNATLVNGANYTADARYGMALQFDGADDYADLGKPAILDNSNHATISMWVKPNQFPTDGDCIGGPCDILLFGYDVYYIAIASSGKIESSWNWDYDYTNTQSNTTIPLDQWTHVVVVKDRGSTLYYFNGRLVDIEADEDAPIIPAPSYSMFHLGDFPDYGSSFYNGTIDSLMIWNRSMTAEEVAQVYRSNFYKHDADNWLFQSDQTNLTPSAYYYSACAGDITGNENCTQRSFTVLSGNSQLGIWDQTDNKPYGNVDAWAGEPAAFYANYTNSTSGVAISGGNCSFCFSDGCQWGAFNASKGLYEMNRAFASGGVYSWNATCNATDFEMQAAADEITIFGYFNDSACGSITAPGIHTLNRSITANDTCFMINATHVTLDCGGHTVTGNLTGYGVLVDSDSATVRNCTVHNFTRGIYVENSNYALLTYNDAGYNIGYGIMLDNSNQSNIMHNTAVKNPAGATFDQNHGIHLSNSNHNLIFNNTVRNSATFDYALESSDYNQLINNTANFFLAGGIELGGNNNLLDGNNFDDQFTGSGMVIPEALLISGGDNNTIRNNYILAKYYSTAIKFQGGENNTFYNNYVNGTISGTSNNYWNTTYDCSSGPNIIGGNCKGGNYYTSYHGQDTDGDGVGDTNIPYNVSGGVDADWLPLTGNQTQQNCSCSSCSECTGKLNDSLCTEVYLTANITNNPGTCINSPANFSNKVFDCQGHVIDGDNNGGQGIQFSGKQNITIRNCTITDFAIGIYITSSSNITIYNSNINHNVVDEASGIMMTSTYNSNITNNNFSANGIYSIYALNSIGNNFTDNTAKGADYGFTLENTSYSRLVGNRLSPINEQCLQVLSHSDYNVIANNNVGPCGDYGIGVSNSSNNTLENNLLNTTWAGIYLFDGSSNNTLDNNTAIANGDYGIYLYYADSNIVSNNLAINNAVNGIGVEHSSNNILTNNTASLNGNDGFTMSGSSDNSFNGNTALNNSVWNFYSESNSFNNTVTNLTIASSLKISFDSKDVKLNPASAPASDPTGYQNISKYVNSTNNSVDSWLYLNVSYDESDLVGVVESSMIMARYNGGWETNTSNFSNVNGVDTENNVVYANITRFSIFAPMQGPLQNNPPGNLRLILNKTTGSNYEDVTLNWTLSNSTNVFNYVIYRTDSWTNGFNFSDPYATVPNDITNWTDVTSDGVNERYYIVRANNTLGLLDENTYAVGKFNLKMYSGWNLISLPLLVWDESMDNIFYTAEDSDISNRWSAIGQTVDRADYFIGFGWFGDYDTMQADSGYWYYSQKSGYDTVPFNNTIVGAVPTAQRSETIYNQMWSLLGWTSVNTKGLDGVFSSATDMDLMNYYDAALDTVKRTDYFGGFGWFGDFTTTAPGRGYWYYSQNTTQYDWAYQP